MRRLVDFLQYADDDLPTAPFILRPGEAVTDPAAWLRSLRIDAAAGPEGPRALAGTLLADLRRLEELFGRPIIHQGISGFGPPAKPH